MTCPILTCNICTHCIFLYNAAHVDHLGHRSFTRYAAVIVSSGHVLFRPSIYDSFCFLTFSLPLALSSSFSLFFSSSALPLFTSFLPRPFSPNSPSTFCFSFHFASSPSLLDLHPLLSFSLSQPSVFSHCPLRKGFRKALRKYSLPKK